MKKLDGKYPEGDKIAACDAADQNGVDRYADHNEKALQPKSRKAAQIVLAHLSPLPVGHGGEGDRTHGAVNVYLDHPPHQHKHDAEGQDRRRDLQKQGLHQKSDQFPDPHSVQLGLHVSQGGGKIDTGASADDARALLNDVLSQLEYRYGDIKGVRDQIDGHERFEDPFEDGKGVKVVEIVPVDDHGDKLIGQDKGDDESRDRHHHVIA